MACPLPGNFIKIAKDGEILVRGQSVMPGYYHLPEQTAEVMPDGKWFHTGDLGSIDRKGQLTITGRKKELIVTAGGKNVSPEVLEDSLATHPLIANVIVVGDQRPYVGALFTLDADMLPDWLSKHGLPQCSPTEAAELPAVRESLEKAVERANKAVSRAESIRKSASSTPPSPLKTATSQPSMKLRRRKVLADYAYEVDAPLRRPRLRAACEEAWLLRPLHKELIPYTSGIHSSHERTAMTVRRLADGSWESIATREATEDMNLPRCCTSAWSVTPASSRSSVARTWVPGAR